MPSHIGKRSTRLVASRPAYISAAPRAVVLPACLSEATTDGPLLRFKLTTQTALCILHSASWILWHGTKSWQITLRDRLCVASRIERRRFMYSKMHAPDAVQQHLLFASGVSLLQLV